ncbi:MULTISPECIES: hypothetical protein [unclassified Symbiopectobacterium]|uniref:hypothetical protein n=1 Tax=unclassified Symbiopectobacterium TaxID=2794573 RepID=UPI0022275544|nr:MULTISPECIES: hypothetical protein [unclassified Symbiopectobacterium]MCW2474432.1 hypothetical protein [Candidatus Symbiopectobacterium sp. NZEC151]MCW2482293.1 hypothetical protein [Candidatus Symbiopectobacterium sp. NZEC135]
MQKHDSFAKAGSKMSDWVTVNEAVHIMKKQASLDLSDSDVYRYAVCNKLHLSIYFQSPIRLRKVRLSKGKIHLIKIDDSLVDRLCLLDSCSFFNRNDLIPCTIGEYISPHSKIIDTALVGHEHIEIQQLLATTLHLHRPLQQSCGINYGISVIHAGELFQVFEICSYSDRIKRQMMRLPKALAEKVKQNIPSCYLRDHCKTRHFPIYHIPRDACFVLRQAELNKLRRLLSRKNSTTQSSTRISSPLARYFWLACKHNEVITPLINQPYKLVSIFEQWALADGFSDRLSGDTLKAALERGKPHIFKG